MADVERELEQIADVLAVRSVADGDLVSELRVLAAPGRASTAIVADVELVLAQRGLQLASEAIHVVQLQSMPDEVEPEVSATPATSGTEGSAVEAIDIESVVIVTADGSARAVVTLRSGQRVATGAAVAVPATVALRRGVAEATLIGLCELFGVPYDLAVEHAIVVSAPPHEVALVTVAAVVRGGEETLVGAVPIWSGGINDAIARAVLVAAAAWVNARSAGAG